jgi:alanine dehydrogenase
MIIGVPKKIKAEENRVAITPAGVSTLVSHGHRSFKHRAYADRGDDLKG